ncbi:MAG TPA: enoyl-CoA hydratase-related protein [Mycobacterium sp.]|nr:enoyl-CoA hydratase-related protein [Mycobacterium sp.]
MIRTEVNDGIATVTLDRPHRLNALTWEMLRRLHDVINEAASADDVRAMVLTGAGRAFCSGADLLDFDAAADDVGAVVEQRMLTTMTPVCQALLRARIPIVAAVNGPCAGGGLGLALLADITIATRSAYFLVPQVASLGIAPDAGITWILARHVGRARALGMCLTGERIDAEQAERWGLIWRCVDDTELLAQAGALATRLASTPEASVITRRLIDAASTTSAAEQLDEEAHAQRLLFGDPAVSANIARFADRGGANRQRRG